MFTIVSGKEEAWWDVILEGWRRPRLLQTAQPHNSSQQHRCDRQQRRASTSRNSQDQSKAYFTMRLIIEDEFVQASWGYSHPLQDIPDDI